MLNIALFEPEIPPNTGNIMRLCANTGAALHLIEPLGFSLDEKRLKRAGLDYRDYADVSQHVSLIAMLESLPGQRLLAVTTKGKSCYSKIKYTEGDIILFGPETRGLSETFLDSLSAEQTLRIPMLANSRSLNLSNAVAVVVYEAWRQLNFEGGG